MNTINEDIEQSKLIADLNRGKNGEDGWNSVIERLAVEVERLREENKALRAGLSRLDRAARRRMMAEDPTAEERLELLRACEAASNLTEALK